MRDARHSATIALFIRLWQPMHTAPSLAPAKDGKAGLPCADAACGASGRPATRRKAEQTENRIQRLMMPLRRSGKKSASLHASTDCEKADAIHHKTRRGTIPAPEG